MVFLSRPESVVRNVSYNASISSVHSVLVRVSIFTSNKNDNGFLQGYNSISYPDINIFIIFIEPGSVGKR